VRVRAGRHRLFAHLRALPEGRQCLYDKFVGLDQRPHRPGGHPDKLDGRDAFGAGQSARQSAAGRRGRLVRLQQPQPVRQGERVDFLSRCCGICRGSVFLFENIFFVIRNFVVNGM